MKALVLREDSLRIEEVEEGELLPGHARLQVLKAGLCGSDMHRFNKPGVGQTAILGHEFVGKVLDLNPGNDGGRISTRIGDIAAACPTLPCAGCQNCRSDNDHLCSSFHGVGRDVRGAFAERVDVPLANLFTIPEGVSYQPSVLADVVAVCLHAIDEIAVNVVGKRCLVVGDGAVGTTLAAVLSKRGAKSVSLSGKHPQNHELLASIAPVQVVDRDDKTQYECVFATVGRRQLDTIEQAISSVAVRGRIIALGVFPPDFPISFNNRSLFLKEASLSASVAYKKDHFARAVQFLLAHPDLAVLITHEFDFSDFAKGIDAMNDKSTTPPVVKVVYNFDNFR